MYVVSVEVHLIEWSYLEAAGCVASYVARSLEKSIVKFILHFNIES